MHKHLCIQAEIQGALNLPQPPFLVVELSLNRPVIYNVNKRAHWQPEGF